MEFLKLAKVNLLIQYNTLLDESKKLRNLITFIIIFSVILFPIEILIIKIYPLLSHTSNESIILNSILNVGFLIITILAITRIINTFLLEHGIFDLWFYPIKPQSIILSKFTLTYIPGFLISLIELIPLMTYGIISNQSIYYYINSILFTIIMPVIPIFIITNLLIILLVIYTKQNFKKNICFYLLQILNGFTFFLFIRINISHISDFQNFLSKIFFNKGLIPNSKLNMFLIFLLIIINVILLFKYIGNIYLNIIMSHKKLQKSKRSLNNNYSYKFVNHGSITSNILRDLKTIVRTPILVVNCLGTSILFFIVFTPIILSISNALKKSNTLIIFIVSMMSFVMASINYVGLISFSREGSNLKFFKSLPLSSNEFLLSKFIVALLSNILNLVTINILIISTFPNLLDIILLNIISIINIVSATIININIDSKSMNLTWLDLKTLFDDYLIIFRPLLQVLLMCVFYILVLFSIENFNIFNEYKRYSIFTIYLIINMIYIHINYKKLKNIFY